MPQVIVVGCAYCNGQKNRWRRNAWKSRGCFKPPVNGLSPPSRDVVAEHCISPLCLFLVPFHWIYLLSPSSHLHAAGEKALEKKQGQVSAAVPVPGEALGRWRWPQTMHGGHRWQSHVLLWYSLLWLHLLLVISSVCRCIWSPRPSFQLCWGFLWRAGQEVMAWDDLQDALWSGTVVSSTAQQDSGQEVWSSVTTALVLWKTNLSMEATKLVLAQLGCQMRSMNPTTSCSKSRCTFRPRFLYCKKGDLSKQG